ncbi:hypothetical protein E2C01_076093 [Portunus trituberculatus]|uniref:Uncharacterized protein n=1 Tax=Portunus trituberculatus TaxID=210409 RepID=A0A5B7IHG1_PORTR|nr:hypothetical protein [Portunus trituberculatus]
MLFGIFNIFHRLFYDSRDGLDKEKHHLCGIYTDENPCLICLGVAYNLAANDDVIRRRNVYPTPHTPTGPQVDVSCRVVPCLVVRRRQPRRGDTQTIPVICLEPHFASVSFFNVMVVEEDNVSGEEEENFGLEIRTHVISRPNLSHTPSVPLKSGKTITNAE